MFRSPPRIRVVALLAALALAACGGEREGADPPPSPTDDPTAVELPAPLATEDEPAAPPAPPPPPSRVETIGPYRADTGRDCDGLPYLSLDTLEGQCVGVALHAEVPAVAEARGRFRPRTLVEDPSRDNLMWVVDHGARRSRAGRVWKLTPGEGGGFDAEAVLQRLDRPHQARVGPDGWIYVGEVQRIIRFDPDAADIASSVERVVDDLPIELPDRPIRFHPLTSFVFAPNWDLVVNMGSGTDRCLESINEDRCRDERVHTAAIWRFRYLGERRWASEPRHVAHGLRNSVALVAHSSGTVLQGENGVDYREDDRPHEELNVIEEGRHYGWPYCYDRDRRDPDWAHASFSCDPRQNARYAPPRLLLPPHGAPLDMLYYGGDRLRGLTGRLIISLHGYRAPGHRLIAFEVDGRGIPAADATFEEVLFGWDASDSGPRGAPVGMTEARDGSLWLVEDHNGTVLRLSADAYAAHRSELLMEGPSLDHIVADALFERLNRDVLRPRCSECHEFVEEDATSSLRALTREGWLRDEEGRPTVYRRTRPDTENRMPLDGPLEPAQAALLDRWLATQ